MNSPTTTPPALLKTSLSLGLFVLLFWTLWLGWQTTGMRSPTSTPSPSRPPAEPAAAGSAGAQFASDLAAPAPAAADGPSSRDSAPTAIPIPEESAGASGDTSRPWTAPDASAPPRAANTGAATALSRETEYERQSRIWRAGARWGRSDQISGSAMSASDKNDLLSQMFRDDLTGEHLWRLGYQWGFTTRQGEF